MRVPEDGDELVRVDLGFDRGERGVAAFVCEGGAHWIPIVAYRWRWRKWRGEEKRRTKKDGSGGVVERSSRA